MPTIFCEALISLCLSCLASGADQTMMDVQRTDSMIELPELTQAVQYILCWAFFDDGVDIRFPFQVRGNRVHCHLILCLFSARLFWLHQSPICSTSSLDADSSQCQVRLMTIVSCANVRCWINVSYKHMLDVKKPVHLHVQQSVKQEMLISTRQSAMILLLLLLLRVLLSLIKVFLAKWTELRAEDTGATAGCWLQWREKGAEESVKKTQERARWCWRAALNADHRQGGISHFNTPAPYFSPW